MINNNIQETYCSFEVSKLLKEVSFGVYCQSWYIDDGKHYYNEDKELTLGWNNRLLPKGEYSRPTHSLAIEWIRVNFGIWIQIEWSWIGDDMKSLFFPRICNSKGQNKIFEYFKTPQEATEAALLYTLQNLIV